MTSGSSESDIPQENKVSKASLDTGQMAFTLAQLESLEICLKEAEEKAKALSEQLSVSEGTKSKLLEQVSRLEEKLEAVDHKEASGGPYEKMVLVKDQCIQKLQAEVKASQEQLIAQKLKHEKKVKKLQTDLATANAITVLELNEKIKTLYEGKPAPREDSLLEGFCGGLPPVEEGDRKISLIMELSTQVSLQTERITQLKEVLEEKERKIQQLEAERSPHPPQEVKDPPGCLPEAPVFSTHDIPPVVSDENL
ncbi:coiled-coil domain-containing protein 192 isoform X2 [Homo sapiens]|nr:coiled-coil domain-containing protein 192 isoform X2 [Homo sapiens]XP_016865296.1 coiled-coil domain-containing protein 192 isoform X2 [Homo sapiens]XP_054209376.1 coiled-coil domain-containing protein 192 isoform X2 [Homo sapiens]XP_054209377.1 coiled-coil domain-containing protein 192 isoform X2 [Homo sapiens]|eukprot:XP_016865295.1 coiled-coil domain-containing protein 192 isoform X2 [Homo sapiens]